MSLWRYDPLPDETKRVLDLGNALNAVIRRYVERGAGLPVVFAAITNVLANLVASNLADQSDRDAALREVADMAGAFARYICAERDAGETRH